MTRNTEVRIPEIDEVKLSRGGASLNLVEQSTFRNTVRVYSSENDLRVK